VREPRTTPIVLSQEEVARRLEAAPGIKYKSALGVAYGAGLRVSEVVALKVSDIDSQCMTLRVEQGKGHKNRYVMLSPRRLELLRDRWRVARPLACLFPGQNPVNPMTSRRGPNGGDRQARVAAHAAAQFRHAFFVTALRLASNAARIEADSPLIPGLIKANQRARDFPCPP
jgi:integrase/recombinase XerD